MAMLSCPYYNYFLHVGVATVYIASRVEQQYIYIMWVVNMVGLYRVWCLLCCVVWPVVGQWAGVSGVLYTMVLLSL